MSFGNNTSSITYGNLTAAGTFGNLTTEIFQRPLIVDFLIGSFEQENRNKRLMIKNNKFLKFINFNYF